VPVSAPGSFESVPKSRWVLAQFAQASAPVGSAGGLGLAGEKETPDGLPLYRYRDLLEHLATLDRQVINFAGQQIEKITTLTPVQACAFDLLGSPVPVRLT